MHSTALTYDDYLAHYGVKGMKWGRRKNSDGSKMSRQENKQAARNERDTESRSRVSSKSGSLRARKTKVIAGIVGKTAATSLGSFMGSNLAGNLTQNKHVRNGSKVASRIHMANLAVTAIKDIRSVARVEE